ncbi:MAG: transporter substrate-binding domain-containing protein [Burkholderiaceae bacterium]|nr:transporter substrate-binding domain-containing protein [Burkholderiaceae bacterium]
MDRVASRIAVFAVLPLLAMPACAGDTTASAPITVSWREKPPYYYTEDGVDKGFMLAYGKEVFAAAGIDARFVREPQKRIWTNFDQRKPNYCSLAWYRLPEREAIAQFSIPVYTDPPHTVLASPAAAAKVQAHASLAALLADPELTLGLVDGVSYGADLDERIAKAGNQVMRRTVSTTNMIQMLAANRFHYMLADRNDWGHMRTHYKEMGAVLQHDVPDMPGGLKRYFLCSRAVPPSVIERLNQAIRTLPKPAPP